MGGWRKYYASTISGQILRWRLEGRPLSREILLRVTIIKARMAEPDNGRS